VSARRITGRHADRSRGQGLVEFALVIPIFFLVVFGLIDGARLVFAYNTVAQAARDAARTAVVEAPFIGKTGPTCTAPTSTCPADTNAFRLHILSAANGASVIIGTIPNDAFHMVVGCYAVGATITTNDCATGNTSGAVVTVKITVLISPLTPFWGPFYPASLTASSTMVMP